MKIMELCKIIRMQSIYGWKFRFMALCAEQNVFTVNGKRKSVLKSLIQMEIYFIINLFPLINRFMTVCDIRFMHLIFWIQIWLRDIRWSIFFIIFRLYLLFSSVSYGTFDLNFDFMVLSLKWTVYLIDTNCLVLWAGFYCRSRGNLWNLKLFYCVLQQESR